MKSMKNVYSEQTMNESVIGLLWFAMQWKVPRDDDDDEEKEESIVMRVQSHYVQS